MSTYTDQFDSHQCHEYANVSEALVCLQLDRKVIMMNLNESYAKED